MPGICPGCKTHLKRQFRFCPYCGFDVSKPKECPACGSENEATFRFCQDCGAALQTTPSMEPDPPPREGITVEFPYSNAQAFDLAVSAAKHFVSFQQYGWGKKSTYRVSLEPSQVVDAIPLLEHLKGWRSRRVYVDGEQAPWDTVFGFLWCYQHKLASDRPELYCFGFEREWEVNIFGCTQANMPFRGTADWLCWGRWLNQEGDWQFDKEQIRQGWEKAIHKIRFCPALDRDRASTALSLLPDVVNPVTDINWTGITHYGDGVSLIYGEVLNINVDYDGDFTERETYKGAAPNNAKVFRDIIRDLNVALPGTNKTTMLEDRTREEAKQQQQLEAEEEYPEPQLPDPDDDAAWAKLEEESNRRIERSGKKPGAA